MNLGQRTYVLGLASVGADGAAVVTNFPFVDTAGNAIKCNYFKLTAAGGSTARGTVIAEVTGLDLSGGMVLNSLSGAPTAAVNASGICGVGFAAAGLAAGEGVWHASNGEVATGINVQVHLITGSTLDLVVEYGNKLPYNSMRTESYDKGV